jgi:hypothetical protein
MLLHPHTSAVWCRSSESDGSSIALAAARQVCNGPPIPGRSASSAAHRGLLLAHFTADLLQITAHGTSAVLVGSMLAMVLGTLLEGTLVGYAQAHVLTARLPSRRARSVDRRHIGTGSRGPWVPSMAAALAQLPSEAGGGPRPAEARSRSRAPAR